MKPSNNLVDFVKDFEGLSLTAYQDSGGIFTVGYGHTATAKQYIGKTITEEKAEDLLMEDLSFASVSVNQLVTTSLGQSQFDAVVDFTFNLGRGVLAKSTLLKLLNSNQFDLVPNEFRKWIFCKGVILRGLVARREAEANLFIS